RSAEASPTSIGSASGVGANISPPGCPARRPPGGNDRRRTDRRYRRLGQLAGEPRRTYSTIQALPRGGNCTPSTRHHDGAFHHRPGWGRTPCRDCSRVGGGSPRSGIAALGREGRPAAAGAQWGFGVAFYINGSGTVSSATLSGF